ncbi:PEPxxWA-CTERM sorting domain-containing protein (plasmid) [Polymorphobacter sp. PAMC 29334]|uniref:PEPxxWA-CTERM sorting domain-containing protein n=1 Tax=Polymorphobacter sp. PAMC 29334 TaxID=2862331 RepID=UPI001C749E11|nr:PEPxxWA-CTERM sorting domain-containing protein [Polymorphobacter sp. PAMC 29334]QYE33398.1 PEPxxWA-CTERM sorting domain-containing protein [Polymorphobacter sp. PAMC 29334]
MKYLVALLIAASAVAPAAAVNLVTNGGFESSSYTSNTQFGAGFGGQGVTGWTGAGGNQLQFYFVGGTQTTTNAVNQFGDPQGYFRPNFSTLSPNGGNFVALDGDSDYRGQISQTLNGLTAGKKYDVTFSWAASQLRNRTGATTEQLLVGFGSATQATEVVAVPSEGFRGWFNEKFSFTAGGASQVLSFLSIGTPNGLPPIAALDGVSVVAGAPEPSAWLLMIAGFGLVGFSARRRARGVAA